MNEAELDQSYPALAQALARVGEARAPLLLAMVCLSLISRQPAAAEVLALIEQAESRCVP